MTAKEKLQRIADTLGVKAIDCHAQGIAHAKRSARIEQIARTQSEDFCTGLVKVLAEEGLTHDPN